MPDVTDKEKVASVLEEIATMLEIKGENAFKCNAYHNASRTIAAYPGSMGHLIESGELSKLKGIGKSLAEKIVLLVQKGRLPYYENLKKEIPIGLLEMVKIPGFGPKKAKAVYEQLEIKSIGELEYACRENRLVDLSGFGLKTQEKILQGIAFFKKGVGKFRINVAEQSATPILNALKEQTDVIRISLCGSIRRNKETIRDIDILVSSDTPAKVMDFFVRLPDIDHIEAKGETKSTVLLKTGMDCDLRIVSDDQFPYAQTYFTGSKEHNVELRGRAKKKFDIKMNEYGLFKGAKEKLVKCKDESEIYEALGLVFIPPEMREAMGEIEAAEKKKIPTLVQERDLKGIIHVHTQWSDGRVDLLDYANYCSRKGLQYIAICDHSKSAYYANGLNEKRVKEQHQKIDEVNEQFKSRGVRLLKGTEVDILPDGSLDFDDKVLASFDMVVASVHSKFKMTERDMTARIIKALRNKYVTMLGHPTGRLILAREGYPVNLEEILEFCAGEGVMIEVNAHPFRLDLDWRYIKKAVDLGVMLSINPDAHKLEELENIRYGVGITRKGWATPRDIINCYQADEAFKLMARRRT